jgi:hypothetical protein
MGEPGADGDGGKDLGGDGRLAQERTVRAERLGGVEEPRGHERPDEDAPEEEDGVGAHVCPGREHESEDGRVHEQEKERVDEGPQEAENAAAVSRRELAARQHGDERPLPVGPDERLQEARRAVR